MTDRIATKTIVAIHVHAARNIEAWRHALKTDAALAVAYRAYELDPMSNSTRELLIIEFARVFAGVLEVQ